MQASARRLLLPATLILLIACWLGGGVTADDTAIDEWLQLLALPVLLLADAYSPPALVMIEPLSTCKVALTGS